MTTRLEPTEAMRRQLIGDVTRELRAPLTGIKGYTEALIDGMMPADVETFQQVYREADRLQRLVNGLQELSHDVVRLLRQIAKEQNRSVVIVSHDQRIRDIADRVLWLEDGQFKEAMTMAIDPVCGMSVEQEKAIRAEWNGQMFCFCAKGCRDEFLGNPYRFVGTVTA